MAIQCSGRVLRKQLSLNSNLDVQVVLHQPADRPTGFRVAFISPAVGAFWVTSARTWFEPWFPAASYSSPRGDVMREPFLIQSLKVIRKDRISTFLLRADNLAWSSKISIFNAQYQDKKNLPICVKQRLIIYIQKITPFIPKELKMNVPKKVIIF